jgi:uncharacterized protein (TIGR01319 family)
MKVYLTSDFGSTFTKLTAIDIESREIIGTAKSFTTVDTNVIYGFKSALDEIINQCGNIHFDKMIASSSAAGGLKMVSSGLVDDITAKASRLAATSAGAKVLKTYSYELSKKEQQEIYNIEPEIVLLSGGIDGGNKDVILHNARMISEIEKKFSVIIAGNKSASDEAAEIINRSGKETVVCENVMPVFNKLNIQPAKKAIRDLFIKNIISAKGLEEVQELMAYEIIPTPLAVFEASQLLSRGTEKQAGLGEIMAYDVGGATTDVYSLSDGNPSRPNVYMQGINEPFAKRTIEGDIGVRYSISSLVEEAGLDRICVESGATEDEVNLWIESCNKNPEILPTGLEKNIDEAMASEAIRISAARHCGFTETTFSTIGEVLIQTGKDLTGVKYIIGTGGSVVNSRSPINILKKSVYEQSDINLLKPISPKFLLDKRNCFAAMGLLGRIEPEIALDIMKKEFVEIN